MFFYERETLREAVEEGYRKKLSSRRQVLTNGYATYAFRARGAAAEILRRCNRSTKIAPITPETPARHRKRISCVILVPATPTSSSRVGPFSPRLLLHAPIYRAAVVVSATRRKALSLPSFFFSTSATTDNTYWT